MQEALLAKVRDVDCTAQRNTLNGLAIRGLVDNDGELTHQGWKHGVGLLPLKEQCRIMGIACASVSGVKTDRHPEFEACRYFVSQGYTGAYCEAGPILLLIRAAALDVFTSLNTLGSRSDACTRFTEAQLALNRDSTDRILHAIRSASVASVVRNFNEIYASSLVQEAYPALSSEMMESLFSALGPEPLGRIAAAIAEDPYTYRSGWPDLTMTNGFELLWAEIKTTDRLHLSQITTLHRMKSLLPGQLKVVQLV